MPKRTIIFSDFYDTLATYAIQGKDEKGLKEFHTITLFLNQYLQANHFMYIISNARGHTTIKDSAIMYNRIYNQLNSAYRNNLFYYALGGDPREQYGENLLNFKMVTGSKEKNVEKIIEEQNITSKDVVVGAGDAETDIDMLLKISDIGGKSFYINRYYDEVKQLDEYYINVIAHKKACFLIQQQYGKSLSLELKRKKVFEKYLSIYNKMKSKYENGDLNNKKLERMYYYSMISSFDYNRVANLERGEQKYISDKELTKKLVLIKNTEELYHQFYKFL